MDRDYRGIILAEVVVVWALYVQREKRWTLFRRVLDGDLVITSTPTVAASGSAVKQKTPFSTAPGNPITGPNGLLQNILDIRQKILSKL